MPLSVADYSVRTSGSNGETTMSFKDRVKAHKHMLQHNGIRLTQEPVPESDEPEPKPVQTIGPGRTITPMVSSDGGDGSGDGHGHGKSNGNGDGGPLGFLEQIQATKFEDPDLAQQMFDGQDSDLKSDLLREQVVAFTSCETYADVHDIDIVHDFIDRVQRRFISLSRQGRSEAVEMERAHAGIVPYSVLDSHDKGR